MSELIKISELVVDYAYQIRVSGNDPEAVERYRYAIQQGVQMDAILVAELDGKKFVYDGFQRVAAHNLEGKGEILADVRKVSNLGELELLACTANLTAHKGKPLTKDDKKQIVAKLMKPGGAWEKMSLALVAVELGLSSHNTVAQWVNELVKNDKLKLGDRSKVTGRDGKTRSTENIGKRLAATFNNALHDEDRIRAEARLARKIDTAVAHEWITPEQRMYRQFKEVSDDPHDTRIIEVLTGEVFGGPQPRPVDVLDEQKRQVQAAEASIAWAAQQREEREQREQAEKKKLIIHNRVSSVISPIVDLLAVRDVQILNEDPEGKQQVINRIDQGIAHLMGLRAQIADSEESIAPVYYAGSLVQALSWDSFGVRVIAGGRDHQLVWKPMPAPMPHLLRDWLANMRLKQDKSKADDARQTAD